VGRREQFQITLNGHAIASGQQQVRYAANGRDTRSHTVKLGPYLAYEAALRPNQLGRGENVLEIAAAKSQPGLVTKINLAEIELQFAYA